jgi:hypothetical protein
LIVFDAVAARFGGIDALVNTLVTGATIPVDGRLMARNA